MGLSYTPCLLMKPVLRLRLHATQSQPCFPAASNALALLGGNVHGNADRAYNTLHFASKVVCQGASPFGNPGQQNRRYAVLSGSIPPFVVSSPFHGLFSPFVKFGVSSFMGYLKGKSALMMFEHHANLKYKFGNRHFWAEGYYVSTVGMNEEAVKRYIKEQERHDMAMDKLSVREYEYPFK